MTEGNGTARGYDVICFSHLRWGFVHQRPQHVLSRLGGRVFYIEEPVEADRPGLRIEQMAEGIWAAVPQIPGTLGPEASIEIQRGLVAELMVGHDIDRYVLWYYTPMAVPLGRNLTPIATVYDCMDELSAFTAAPRDLREREGELFDSADLVFTGGRSLFEAKRDRHQSVHLFPSAVDAEHFGRARTIDEEHPAQAHIGHPRLGFVGVIDERLDPGLVAGIAAARPDWQVVMVGPPLKIDERELPRGPNIHWLGAAGYDELPALLAGWDAGLLPFALNDATRYISPTKTPEYLAAGLPVVSTPITDVVRDYGDPGLVRIASGPEEFVRAVEEALAEDHDARLARVDPVLEERSWDATVARMSKLIDGVLARRARTSGAPIQILSEPVRVPDPKTHDAFDYMVVGAGYAGSVVARELAEAGNRVVVVDRRGHVGGNAYDEYDHAGVLVHRYGPHIFHTNSREVFDYLSRFTSWRPYEHRVLASVDGRLVPLPINLDTINDIYGLELSSPEAEAFLARLAQPVEHVRTSEDVVVSKVGRELYEKFFRGYTRKQWGLDPSELDAKVAGRIPVRTNRDPRYFNDTYQALPAHGYTAMFRRILDHPRITVLLQADHRDISALVPHRELVYTGPIDEFFDHRFGKLPYRSLRFEFETLGLEVAQPAAVINYPNQHAYTRVTEFKYLTGQSHRHTTLVYEYPQAEGDPYYPIPRPENEALYKRYRELADTTPSAHFVGRLANYRYYNMDQVVAQALATAARILEGRNGGGRAPRPRAVGRGRVHS